MLFPLKDSPRTLQMKICAPDRHHLARKVQLRLGNRVRVIPNGKPTGAYGLTDV